MLLSTLGIAARCIFAPLEILPNLPFLCANRTPIRYGFGVGTKAILCRVHIALVDQQGALHLYSINTFCSHFLYY